MASITVKSLAFLFLFIINKEIMTKNVKVISRKGKFSIVLAEEQGRLYLATPGLDGTKYGRESDIANEVFNEHFSEEDFGQRRIYATDSFSVVANFDSYQDAIDYVLGQSLDNSLAKNDIIATRQSARYFTDDKIDEIDNSFWDADKTSSSLDAIAEVATKLSTKIRSLKEAVRASANGKCNKSTQANLDKLTSTLKFIGNNDVFNGLIKLGNKYLKETGKFDPATDLKDLLPKSSKEDKADKEPKEAPKKVPHEFKQKKTK